MNVPRVVFIIIKIRFYLFCSTSQVYVLIYTVLCIS